MIIGLSLLHWAAFYNHVAIVKYLVKSKANVNLVGGDFLESALMLAVRNSSYTYLVYYLIVHAKADVHIKNRNGHDALHIACQHECVTIAYLLLHLGNAYIDAMDNSGDTPLYWSLKNNPSSNIDMKRMLLKHNANVTLLNNSDKNALSVLACNRDIDMGIALMIYEAASKSHPISMDGFFEV
jgi:ankyrin repeat protein